MTDRIELLGLTAHGRHGVFPEERRDGQRFVVDAVLDVDTRAAAASDDLTDTVDYAALAASLTAVIEGPPVKLIETLAARLADVCLADARVRAVEITVHKPAAPVGVPLSDIAVRIARERP